MHCSSGLPSVATRFAVTVQEADRFVRNGVTTFVFYVVPVCDIGPLKTNQRYLLSLSEKDLHDDRHAALVVLARRGQTLGFDMAGLLVSPQGDIWFNQVSDVLRLPLNEPIVPPEYLSSEHNPAAN